VLTTTKKSQHWVMPWCPVRTHVSQVHKLEQPPCSHPASGNTLRGKGRQHLSCNLGMHREEGYLRKSWR
jgi:hypothetical protein